jgi:hypothetical protein
MQPTGNGWPLANGRRLASQDQKGGLERVLRIRFMAQHVPANIQHKPAMAPHQHSERNLVPVLDKSQHQVTIRQILGVRRVNQVLDAPKNSSYLTARHEYCLLNAAGETLK